MNTNNIITFTASRKPNGWLGNMSAFPIQVGNDTYRTSEAFFQALRFDDPQIREQIRNEKSPMDAKAVMNANSDKIVVPKHSIKDVMNMKMVLKMKIDQHIHLKYSLMNTGDARIIEDVTARGDKGGNLFWGMMLVDGQWVGQNVLGKLWMEIRDELILENFE